MRGWWPTLLGSLLLAGGFSRSIAEEITLTTYYPSPRAVYNELLANVYRDFGDPANRYLDPDGPSQLQSVQFSGSLTLGGRLISGWEQVIPPASVVMVATTGGCPDGYAQIAGSSVSRMPRIANVPGATGGDFFTGLPDSVTAVAPPGGGGKKSPGPVPGESASAGHRHQEVVPLYRAFVFCQREGSPPGSTSPLAPLVDALAAIDAQIDAIVADYLAVVAEYEAAVAAYDAAVVQYNDAVAQYNAAEAQYQQALLDFNDGLITQADLDAAQAVRDAKKAAMDAKKAEMDAKEQVKLNKEQEMLAKRAWAQNQLLVLTNNWLNIYITQLGADGRKELVLTPEQLAFLNVVDSDRPTFIAKFTNDVLELDPNAMTDAEENLWNGITDSIWLYLAL